MDRSYAAVWSGEAGFGANSIFGLDPAAHLQRCRELESQGYRMISLSVARISPGGPPVTASVWHRPVISEQARDRLAERQARAAIALIRMGKAEEVWPLLRHSADPRVTSFIVNRLKPLGADAVAVAAEVARLESIVGRGSPDPALPRTEGLPVPALAGKSGDLRSAIAAGSGDPRRTNAPAGSGDPRRTADSRATQKMDAILFDPETSIRRALILALGTYGPDSLSLPASASP